MLLWLSWQSSSHVMSRSCVQVASAAPRRGKPFDLPYFFLQKIRLRFIDCRSFIPQNLLGFVGVLFIYKRARDVSLSLPTCCELRFRHSCLCLWAGSKNETLQVGCKFMQSPLVCRFSCNLRILIFFNEKLLTKYEIEYIIIFEGKASNGYTQSYYFM